MESKLAKKEGEYKRGLRDVEILTGPMNFRTQRGQRIVGYRVTKTMSLKMEGGGTTAETGTQIMEAVQLLVMTKSRRDIKVIHRKVIHRKEIRHWEARVLKDHLFYLLKLLWIIKVLLQISTKIHKLKSSRKENRNLEVSKRLKQRAFRMWY